LIFWGAAILIYGILNIILYKVIFTKFENKPAEYTYENIKNQVNLGKHLFVYENDVLDLTDYLPLHPGSNLLENYSGTEISRFIYGGYYSKGYKHFHSDFVNILIERYKCGNIKSQFKLYENSDDKSNDACKIWKLTDRIKVSSIHSIMQFTNKSMNVVSFLYGINHCGCYITVFFLFNKIR